MTNTEKIKELQSVVNQLLVQTALITSKLEVTTSMVLGVYAEKMTEGESKTILSNYCTRLEEAQMDALSKLSDLVFEDGDHSLILRNKTAVFSSIQHLRQSLGLN